MESSKPGQGKLVKVALKVSSRTSGLPSQESDLLPCLTCRIAWGRAPREHRSGHLHAAGLYQVPRERERPETCELKKKATSVLGRSFRWLKNRKAKSINTCISKLLQPVLSTPCNLFLSCTMMPESKSHLPQVIITLSQQETCCMLLHPLQPSTT